MLVQGDCSDSCLNAVLGHRATGDREEELVLPYCSNYEDYSSRICEVAVATICCQLAFAADMTAPVHHPNAVRIFEHFIREHCLRVACSFAGAPTGTAAPCTHFHNSTAAHRPSAPQDPFFPGTCSCFTCGDGLAFAKYNMIASLFVTNRHSLIIGSCEVIY